MRTEVVPRNFRSWIKSARHFAGMNQHVQGLQRYHLPNLGPLNCNVDAPCVGEQMVRV